MPAVPPEEKTKYHTVHTTPCIPHRVGPDFGPCKYHTVAVNRDTDKLTELCNAGRPIVGSKAVPDLSRRTAEPCTGWRPAGEFSGSRPHKSRHDASDIKSLNSMVHD